MTKTEFHRGEPIEKKLSSLIRIPTVANTQLYEIAGYRRALASLFPRIFAQMSTESVGEALLLKLSGSEPELRGVLFLGHMDVVSADPEGWTHPPFSGYTEGGRVWGRGTLDMKGAQCALLEALEGLLQRGYAPKRTVYLYLSCDEEIGGPTSALAARTLAERGIAFEAIFDEGGTIGWNHMGKAVGRCALVAVAEKGSLEYRFTARSRGGHAAMPMKDSPLVRLARLIVDLEENAQALMPRVLMPEVAQILLEAAAHMAQEDRDCLENAVAESSLPALREVLGPAAEALMGATIAFSMMQAGSAFNVMPKQAVLTANVRTTLVQREVEITRLLKDKAAEYEVDCECAGGSDASAFSLPESFGYRAVKRTVERQFGGMPVIPILLLGGTDSKHFGALAQSVIRFSPISIEEFQGKGVHGVDEYITVESLREAVGFYERLFLEEI